MFAKSVRLLPALICFSLRAAAPVGVFEDHADVGAVLHSGTVEYDGTRQSYTVAGSGENMWFATDAFQFAWKKISGDVTLTADVSFIGAGKEGHRKAVLMIRQSLDTGSAYADVARHGDGLTSLQARDVKDANTAEVQAPSQGPSRLRIVKRGDQFYIFVAGPGEELKFAGGSMRIPMHDPFYVGIGVCSHNKDVVEKAVFSNVSLQVPGAVSPAAPVLYSALEVIPVSGDRRAVFVSEGKLTMPQWSRDGSTLIFHRGENMEQVALAGGQSQSVTTVEPFPQSPYPGVSPDQQQIASLAPEGQDVLLRILSIKDNKVKVLARIPGNPGTIEMPAWSPDSRRLAFISYHMVP